MIPHHSSGENQGRLLVLLEHQAKHQGGVQKLQLYLSRGNIWLILGGSINYKGGYSSGPLFGLDYLGYGL